MPIDHAEAVDRSLKSRHEELHGEGLRDEATTRLSLVAFTGEGQEFGARARGNLCGFTGGQMMQKGARGHGPIYGLAVSLDKPAFELIATVLGAGTMGAQIAAHLANCGIKTFLLDIVPAGASAAARSDLAAKAIKQLSKSKPPALMLPAFIDRISGGNLEDDLERCVGQSDLVIEAVVERLDIKQALFAKVAAFAQADAVLATNTSGIPINAIAANLPDHAAARLVGLHFFNPPRYMHLLEVVPSAASATNEALLASLRRFGSDVLGKGVVVCKDTPNFIGNRIGTAEMILTFELAQKGYTVEEVDLLNGSLMGRPRSGSFRLGDMVGLDILVHVINNLRNAVSDDPSAKNFDPLKSRLNVPAVVHSLVDSKRLGDKTGSGFYRKAKDADGKSVIESLDLATLNYRAQQKAAFPELRDIAKTPQLERRAAAALRAEGRAGDFLRALYLPLFNYAATLVGSICESPQDIDEAMCWGYGWKLGPFALWDAVGLHWSKSAMESLGIKPAPAFIELLEKSGEKAQWYGYDSAFAPTVYVPSRGVSPYYARKGELSLAHIKARGADLDKTSTAGLIDLGDGIACVEFRSKMNTLDEGVLTMLARAPQVAREKGFIGLVIGNQEDDFSLGANLMQVMAWIMSKNFAAIESAVATFQNTMMDLRHAPIPVVGAPFGRTLGGGVELSLHCDALVAHAELYMGLVELGVGLLPAGGGLKEICRRAAAWADQVPDGDGYPWVLRGFQMAAGAKVSGSAHEARANGWLATTDSICANKAQQIAAAKRRALALATAGYEAPSRHEPIAVIGGNRAANFVLGAKVFQWGGYASEHDRLIAVKIAHVLGGGSSLMPTSVSAQHLLDLEREAFVSLCGEPKTLARIGHTLEKGKPLRN
jgi:3-hydroxyacyl-CoA dehydrogenase